MGYIERMSEERMIEMILNAKIDSGRRRGRPRKRCIDDFESDMRSLGIRNWKANARNRNEWKAVVREAKVHFTGLYDDGNDFITQCAWNILKFIY